MSDDDLESLVQQMDFSGTHSRAGGGSGGSRSSRESGHEDLTRLRPQLRRDSETGLRSISMDIDVPTEVEDRRILSRENSSRASGDGAVYSSSDEKLKDFQGDGEKRSGRAMARVRRSTRLAHVSDTASQRTADRISLRKLSP